MCVCKAALSRVFFFFNFAPKYLVQFLLFTKDQYSCFPITAEVEEI